MKSQIYTHQSIRERHIRQINDFVWPFYNKILPQFHDIEIEADNAAREYLEIASSRFSEDDDPDAYYEAANEHGLSHYSILNLGRYTATLAWHATLFEFFHQQIRLFLFSELSHNFAFDSKVFCEKFTDVKACFLEHNFDVSKLASWSKLIELQTLCNAIKHGDGNSLQNLRAIAPEKFKSSLSGDLFELYKTTLLEVTLDLNEETLSEYVYAIINFWNDLPERCFSDANHVPLKKYRLPT